MADGRGPSPRSADGDIPDLPVLREIAEEHEIAKRVSDRLLVKGGLEDARIELGRGSHIRDDDVKMFDTKIIERQHPRWRLCTCQNGYRCREGDSRDSEHMLHKRTSCLDRRDTG